MYSKSVILMIFVFAAMLIISPDTATADTWSFSPYRAQLAAEDDNGQSSVDLAVAEPEHPNKKNVGRGVMFSLVIPGAGQLYSGSWLRAVPWFAVEVAAWALFSSYNADGNDKTDEFEAYAGPHKNTDPAAGHFNYDAYMLREYQIATNATLNEQQTEYGGNLSEWMNEAWEYRSDYLPPPYGHNINTLDIQQYYEMIGKYYDQFGYGWIDTYDHTGPITGIEGNIWTGNPLYPDAKPDDPDGTTIGYDGYSPFFFHYRDMRGEANDALDKANVMMEIVLANHVLSALDAAFAIRSFNRKLDRNSLGDLKLHYDIKDYDGQTARMLTLSYPLDRK